MRRALSVVLSLCLTAAYGAPCSAAGAAATATLQKIGVAGAVRGSVKAFSPGEKPIGRDLASGQPLYLNEKIATGPEGRLQVMLQDETIFTIGPNSSMVLDEFVYDPESRAGKVTARVTSGVFRFVTGQIGHRKPSDMKVKFPTGTMGIRGTIVAGEVTPEGTTAVLLGPGPATNASEERVGAFTMENAGAKVDVVKPGFSTRVEGDKPPTAPALMTRTQLDSILGQISRAPQGPRTAAAPAAEPEAKDGPASADDASPDSASDASGQSTAQASGDLSTVGDIADLAADLGNATLAAANDIGNPDLAALIAANQSSWDDVRSITSGTGYYAGSDVFNLTQCAGGACANPSGSVSLYLDIDFGAKTVGSAASNVSVYATDPTLAAPISETVSFPTVSYAGTAGPATLSGMSGSGATTANVSILNINGTAQSAVAIAKYNAGGTTGSGFTGAPLTCTSVGGCR